MAEPLFTPVLNASGLLMSVEAPDTDESKNFYLYGPEKWTTVALDVRQGVLEYDAGGFDLAAPKSRPRIVAVPGPRCTILGIARTLDTTFNSAATSSNDKLSLEEIARALFMYNANWLGAPMRKNLLPVLPEWQVGSHLTLPIETRLGVGDDHLTVDLAAMRQWANAFSEQNELWLIAEAASLTTPDPDALSQGVAGWLAGKSVAAIASDLAGRLLLNPFDSVFRIVEILIQLRNVAPPNAVPVVISTLKLLLPHQADLLAWGAAGQAVLRQFHFILHDAELIAAANPNQGDLDQGRALIGQALGLKQDGADWKDPREWGPKIVPSEPPLLPKQQRVVTGDIKKGTLLFGMVYGRTISVGKEIIYPPNNPIWIGPSEEGELDPITWWKPRQNLLAKDLGPAGAPANTGVPVPAAKVIERIDVAARIAINEGLLDACRAADVGLISTGMHQWSAHVGEEFAAFLEKFRRHYPEHYDLLFGTFRLQVKLWAPPKKDKKEPDGADPAFAAQVVAANPFADPTEPNTYFPTYATLFDVPPGAGPKRLPPVADDKDARLVFFGGTTGKTHKFSAAWSARVRLAALVSIPYCIVELHTAAWRFTRIMLDGNFAPLQFNVDGEQHGFAELFPCAIGAALVLDQHINAPKLVNKSVQLAIDRTPGQTHRLDGTLDENWLRRFTINFLAVRSFPDASAKRDRDGRIITYHDQPVDPDHIKPDHSLSPDPGSFRGW